jgi:hypothetical protein
MITTLVMMMIAIALLRIEYWPFTAIPMYSFLRGKLHISRLRYGTHRMNHRIDSSYDYKFLRDATQAQAVACEHIYSRYPNAIAW